MNIRKLNDSGLFAPEVMLGLRAGRPEFFVKPGSKRAKYLFARMRLAVIVAGVRKERN